MESIDQAVRMFLAMYVKPMMKEIMGEIYTEYTKSTENKADALLTTSEVCKYLKVDRHHVYRLVEGNVLPAARFGNEYRFRSEDIQEYLDKLIKSKKSK